MPKIKAALLGLGTVGRGVYESICTHQRELRRLLGAEVEIAGVLIQDEKKPRDIESGILVTADFSDILALEGLDVIFEALIGTEPAYSYIDRAMEEGIHVITANKVMFAERGQQIVEKARLHGVKVGYEAAVAGGIPVIRTIRELLQINKILRIQAVLNGTSNYILTAMRTEKTSFEAALNSAQEKGYAEADPSNDIDGTDAFCKMQILCRLAFGSEPDWSRVEKQGIGHLSRKQIQSAERKNTKYKHIADITAVNGIVHASLKPVLLEEGHPLYNVEGADNAVSIQSSLLGNLLLIGPGAGSLPTASAMIEDLASFYASAISKEIAREKQIAGA